MRRCVIILSSLLATGISLQSYSIPIHLPNQKEVTWQGAGRDSTYALPDRWIDPQSVAVTVDSVLWQSGVHYWLEPPGNRLRFYRIIEPNEAIQVSYRTLPFALQNSYYHRDLSMVVTVKDSGGVSTSGIPMGQPMPPSPAYGSNLRRSGSLVRRYHSRHRTRFGYRIRNEAAN